MQAVLAQVVVVFKTNMTKIYAAHSWQHSIHIWLLGRSVCSSSSDQRDPCFNPNNQWTLKFTNENLNLLVHKKFVSCFEHFDVRQNVTKNAQRVAEVVLATWTIFIFILYNSDLILMFKVEVFIVAVDSTFKLNLRHLKHIADTFMSWKSFNAQKLIQISRPFYILRGNYYCCWLIFTL